MTRRNAYLSAIALPMAALTTAAAAQDVGNQELRTGTPFTEQVLTTGLEFPWEITWGPDDHLWVTERTGKRVTRVDPETGEKMVAVTIEEVLVGSQHEGLLGLALDPQFGQEGSNHVYVAYTYDADPAEGEDQLDRQAKVVRYTFDAEEEVLGDPVDVITGVPAGNDHNAGRLKFGPDGKLYYTLGEQGANQFGNYCNPIRAQVLPTREEVEGEDWSSYSGKILRMNPDGSIPEDNPTIDGVKSHIFSYGHRNPQGIVFGPDGTLYQAEQGPSSDDEVNIIEAGKNYGWPHVAGYQDDNAYLYANWSAAANCEQLEFTGVDIPEEVPQQSETEWSHPDFVEPLKSLYTVPDTYNFQDPTCDGMYFICWPTIAPPSIDYYPADGAITEWSNSLLLTSLKNGALYVLPLTEDRRSVQGDVDQVFGTVNRYRDLVISPDTTEIFVATDSGGIARDTGGGVSQELENPGSILKFSYDGMGADTSGDGEAAATTD